MLSCRPVATRKERPYRSNPPGAPRDLQNQGQTSCNIPRTPGTAGHSSDSPEWARTWHPRSSWGHIPVPAGRRYGPGRAPKSGTDDTSSISAVDRRCVNVQRSMSSCLRRLQKLCQRRLYRRGKPDNGTNATPAGPDPSTARRWHDLELKESRMSGKGNLAASFRWQWDLSITTSQVQGRKPPLTGQHVQSIVDARQGVSILDCRQVQPVVVHAESSPAVLLKSPKLRVPTTGCRRPTSPPHKPLPV